MGRHLDLDALLAQCRAGRGVIIVVEGERDEDDAWFYNRWFAPLGPQVTFHPQNGHRRVEAAVHHLRGALPHRPVLGLVDRDLRDLAPAAPLPDGVYAITRFTLENYLLAPQGWARLLALTRRSAPESHVESVSRAVEASLRACVPAAAYNQVLHSKLPGQRLLTSLNALPADPYADLQRRPDGHALAALYSERVAELAQLGVEDLHRHVSGKLAMPELDRRLELRGQWRLLLGPYMQVHPEPPSDLDALVRDLLSRPSA